MAYLGNQPSNNFVSLKRQVITGNGGTSYTLDHSVASVNDVAIFVNNVRQDPASYSISGTALTLGGTISSSDSCYVIFLGQALQTVVPDTNTITNAMIQDGTIAESKLASGVNTITMADQWRLSADTNSGVSNDITSNWERNDSIGYASIGTGLTENSGIFSFPQTGIYLITWTARIDIADGDNFANSEIRVTTDNGTSFNLVGYVTESNRNSGGTQIGTATVQYLFDVTDISTHKFKFSSSSFDSGTAFTGFTDRNGTHFTVIRLGDT